jgi:NDMA-dependent alcohol dehydrogenase
VKTKAAVLYGPHTPYSVETIELDPPKENEVLVQIRAVGLCHSDEHLVTGDLAFDEATQEAMGHRQFPIISGHEVAGEVIEVGPGLRDLAPGDHIVTSFVPSCGECEMCATGHQALCDTGANTLAGLQNDGTSRHHSLSGTDISTMCALGGFAEYSVMPRASVIKVAPHVPFAQAALVSCGVVTGWGSSVYAADVRPGETVLIVGAGGVGMSAVQGAAMAGALNVVVVDPVAFKREQAPIFGATHAVSSLEEAAELIGKLTWGRQADKAIMTMGEGDPDLVGTIMAQVRKGGRVVITSVTAPAKTDAKLSLFELAMYQKELVGCLFGNGNPRYDVPRLLSLYDGGQLKLDELITRTYSLDQINEAYQDMRDGRNLRGVITF